MKMLNRTALASLALLALSIGCAHEPSAELSAARNTYEQARKGEPNQLAPAQVYEAQKALHRAEEAFDDDPGSEEERDLAYVAHRKAEYAIAVANMKKAERSEKEARSAYLTTLASQRDEALELTEQQRDQLEDTQSRLQDTSAALADAQAKQQQLNDQLTAAMASLNEMASLKQEQDSMVITLNGSVLFKTGSADLMSIAEERLKEVANVISQYDDDHTIVVEGHTDSRGSDEFNRTLSQNRAQSVMQYLMQNGVDSKALRAEGRGEAEPIATNDNPEGRANNRRVEIVITANQPGAKSGPQGQGVAPSPSSSTPPQSPKAAGPQPQTRPMAPSQGQ